MSGYHNFASVYDKLTGNISYGELSDYYNRLILKFGGKREILLDLGCGTGSMSMEMSKLGYDVIGVDASADMLGVAMDKPHEKIVYLCQDMCDLDMYGTVDAVICVLDSINHIGTKEMVQECFNNVSFFTNKDGLFLFDMNTINKHRNILGNNVFVYDIKDVYCVWQNEYVEEENRVYIWLDIFCTDDKNKDLYTRYDDEFSEIAFSISDTRGMLEKADFEVLACYDYLTENDGNENSEKVIFVARKKNQPGDLRLKNSINKDD